MADIMKDARRIFAGMVCGLLLAGCKPSAYPKIKSDETLRQECLHLLEATPVGDIAREKWPKSIAALRPVLVEREENDIRIWTHQERGNYASGYYVFPNSPAAPPSQGVRIKRTQFKGVYRFEQPW